MFFFSRKKTVPLKEIEDVYYISLLFSEKVELPDDETIVEQLKTVFKKVTSENNNKNKEAYRIFGILDYARDVEEVKQVPAHLAMEKQLCSFQIEEREKQEIEIQPDCEEAEEILKNAKYELGISDFLSIDLTPKERGYLITNWIKLMAFIFPDCIGIYNYMSKKIMSRSQILALFARDDTYSFMQIGVKLRLYPIQGRDEILIDTLGLYGVDLVDLQYHLKRTDPSNFLEHAQNMAAFLYENEIKINQGDVITGIASSDTWICRYEKSIALPKRRVLDIDTGKYAAKRKVQRKKKK